VSYGAKASHHQRKETSEGTVLILEFKGEKREDAIQMKGSSTTKVET
jgi:hypothetical protein